MSNDLISRKALMNEIEESMNNNIHSNSAISLNHRSEHIHFMSMVSNAPAAYDVDAVCEEIKKREKKFREYGEKYNDGEGISAAEACAGDIEIVRNGRTKE